MNKNTEISSDDYSNIIANYLAAYILDEGNFADFEHSFLPTIKGGGRRQFQNVRTGLASRSTQPSAQQEIESIRGISQAVTSRQQTQTLDRVDENAKEARDKTDDILKDISNLRNDINLDLNDLSEEISNKIDLLLNKLEILENKIDNINNNSSRILELLDDLKNILDLINGNINDFIKLVENNFTLLTNDIKKVKEEILGEFAILNNQLNNFVNKIKDEILGAVKSINTNTDEAHGITRVAIEAEADKIIAAFTEELAGLGTELNGAIVALGTEIEASLKIKFNSLESLIADLKNSLKEKIEEGLNEWFSENKENILLEIVSNICDRIVGESYIKYDNSYRFLPTLLFKFKSIEDKIPKKYSQIKLRLNLKPDEITETIVSALRFELKDINEISYTYGNLKCVYVGEKKMFKTTIFCNSKESVFNILEKLIPITKTKYIKENISFIENSIRKDTIRIKRDLDNAKINPKNDYGKATMVLCSAYLQVNGLDKQIWLM